MTSSSSPAKEHPRKVFGWAARDNSGVLAPFTFSRRNTGDDDVTLKILYCGICHTDLSIVKNEWGNAVYPVVPGHEIVGIVSEVGRNVNRFKVGDKVGVGCLVGSCRSCGGCNAHAENFCPKQVFTYNGIDADGTKTYGGYSNMIVVNEHFVVKFPDNLPMDKGAPLLCAGITVYSPMKKFGLNVPGKHIGVVGLGGVGHVAVKFAKALGVKVTVISSSASKEKEAIEHLGADSFILSSNPEAMQAAMFSLDGIINTVSAVHDLVPLLNLLQPNGQMILVGMPDKPFQLPVFPLSFAARIIAGTYIGGIKDTQEMMDLAGKHNITADIELIPRDYVNKAMERLEKGDVRYRFVIDVANPGTKAKSNL